jgi:hypothetical protein
MASVPSRCVKLIQRFWVSALELALACVVLAVPASRRVEAETQGMPKNGASSLPYPRERWYIRSFAIVGLASLNRTYCGRALTVLETQPLVLSEHHAESTGLVPDDRIVPAKALCSEHVVSSPVER